MVELEPPTVPKALFPSGLTSLPGPGNVGVVRPFHGISAGTPEGPWPVTELRKSQKIWCPLRFGECGMVLELWLLPQHTNYWVGSVLCLAVAAICVIGAIANSTH